MEIKCDSSGAGAGPSWEDMGRCKTGLMLLRWVTSQQLGWTWREELEGVVGVQGFEKEAILA